MANEKSAAPRATSNRSTTPLSDGFRSFISGGWAERPAAAVSRREEAGLAAQRRARNANALKAEVSEDVETPAFHADPEESEAE